MTILLGVDTGGTYTDAVLIRDETKVIAHAKSLTTRHDLAIGIGAAIQSVLQDSKLDPKEVVLASLSTTLATNALVEGQGERVGLIYIGFKQSDLDSHGLTDAMRGDPVVVLTGGHDHAGNQVEQFDAEHLRNWLQNDGREVSAFAVASQFATRNPAHEIAASEIIAQATGKPVSMSHHL